MENRRPWIQLLDWFREDQRRSLAAVGTLTVFLAVSIGGGVYLASGGDGGGPTPSPSPSPTPFASECSRPTLIDVLPAEPEGDWKGIQAPQASGCFSLTATTFDAGGVAVDTAFVLEAKEPQDVAQLTSRIRVEPALEISAEQVLDDQASLVPAPTSYRYRITPAGPLAVGEVYEFTLLDKPDGQPVRSWAFQTQQPLRVTQTLPADQATNVPTNVGIELTFSHDGATGAEERFEISPATEGRFEIHKRVLVFVPKELKKETLYTVRLKAGVGIPGSGETMAQDFRFQFETGSSDRTGDTPSQAAFQFSRRVWESSTGDTPALGLFAPDPNTAPVNTLPFTVYRFPEMDGFLGALDQFTALPSWAYISRSRFSIDTSGLEAVASFNTDVKSVGQYYSERYTIFPEPLPQGFYLVEAVYEDRRLQTLLQVTDIGAYVSLSRTKTLVWVNDLATKSPLAGAAITATIPGIGETAGSDGVALFDTPPDLVKLRQSYYGYSLTETVGNLIVTAADGRASVIPLADIFSGYQTYGFREYGFQGDPSLYWRFLYTERHLYHPTDRIHFWGLIRLRENPPSSQDVTVELSGFTYESDKTYQRRVAAQTTVATNEMGTFIGELPFEGVSPGWYQLDARVGDQVITSRYIEVKDFVKPAYKIDIVPEKKAIIRGETINVLVKASFFDGTPVANLGLTYRDGKGTDTSIVTDTRGEATASFEGNGYPDYYSGYYGAYLSAGPTLAEEGEISGSASVLVFPASITVDAAAEYADGQGIVSGTVYNLNLDRINNDEASDFSDFHGTPAGGRTVTATVTEQSYNKVEIGETYDFIAKIVRKEYRYDSVSTDIGTFRSVSNGEGAFEIRFPAEQNKSYSIKLNTQDDAGRTFVSDLYLYSGKNLYGNNSTFLEPDDRGPFSVGDEVAVTMVRGEEEFPAGGDNRYLFYTAQNGIRSYAVSSSPRYSFTFAAEHVPTISVSGARFTGGTYLEVNYPFSAGFDHAGRELNVTVEPQEEKYEPGDTAGLDVMVTDQGGNPVQAEVLLSGVDEAIFREEGDSFFYDLDILDGLYTDVSAGIYHTYASHQSPVPTGGAERGGDGGSRQNFEDVALFQRVVTDASGHASVTFDLPDNLTSWRVSALAVTPDLYAGRATALVPVSLPLFVDVAMNTSYLTTDKPSVKVRAFGDDLSAGDDVSFEVTSPTLFEDTLRATGSAFAPAEVALPALREGHHEIHFKVSADGHDDEIVRTVEVVPSRLLRTEAHYYEVSPGQSIAPEGAADRPTTVVITDHNRGRYYPVLGSLIWTYGDRLDQMLARNIAQELLTRHFGEEPVFPAEFRASAYQKEGGGLGILPFADEDLILSARAAALAPDMFGQQALAKYLRRVLNDPDETREQAIIALYGLAALGEPALLDIQQAAALGDLTPRERLYLGLAAAETGDEDTAGQLYGGLLEEFGERRGAAIRLNVGADADDILEATSLAAGLGALLADDYAPLLFEYTTANYTRETLIQLDQLTYLVDAMPRLSEAAVQVSYTVDGEAHDEQLERGQSVALTLSPQQLTALNLQVTDGTAGVSTSFLAPFDPASVQADPAVSISRSYEGQIGDAATVQEGQLVRITLSWDLTADAVDGCYQVSDLLPSGLRPVTRLYEKGITESGIWYPYFIEGQRVSFCLYKGSERRPIIYYARVIGTGTYTAEPTTMQSQQAQESISVTGAIQVEIK